MNTQYNILKYNFKYYKSRYLKLYYKYITSYGNDILFNINWPRLVEKYSTTWAQNEKVLSQSKNCSREQL